MNDRLVVAILAGGLCAGSGGVAGYLIGDKQPSGAAERRIVSRAVNAAFYGHDQALADCRAGQWGSGGSGWGSGGCP